MSPASASSPTHGRLEGFLTMRQRGTNEGLIITFHTLIEGAIVTFNESRKVALPGCLETSLVLHHILLDSK